MKGKKNNVVNDFMNNLSNNVNFKINKVDSMVDMLSVALIVIILALVGMDVKIPQESKMAFLLALIILVSCYSIDIAIVVAVIAIIYVLIQNNNATEEFSEEIDLNTLTLDGLIRYLQDSPEQEDLVRQLLHLRSELQMSALTEGDITLDQVCSNRNFMGTMTPELREKMQSYLDSYNSPIIEVTNPTPSPPSPVVVS